MKSKTRLQYIDILKCFAIFLVILGHAHAAFVPDSSCMTNINDFILSFHMPLFAVLSGVFFSSDKEWKLFIRDKFIQLIVPIICYSVIIWGILRIINDFCLWLHGNDSIHFYAIMRNIYYGITEWSLWFLKALFLCFVVAYISIKSIKGNVVVGGIISLVLMQSFSWFGIISNKAPLFTGFVFLYPFFVSGILLQYYKIFDKSLKKKALWSLVVFIVCLIFWKGHDDTFYGMNTCIYAKEGNIIGYMVVVKTLYRFVTGLAGSLFYILFFKILFNNHRIINNSFVQVLSRIGQYTLGIYIYQSFVYQFAKPLQGFSEAIMLLISVAISLLILYLGYVICKIGYKIPILSTFLFGQKIK